MAVKIPLVNTDKYAVVDDGDYKLVSRFNWHLKTKKGRHYARCKMFMGYIDGKSVGCSMYLHRLIMRPSGKMQIDHKDHNSLNCKRENMRECTNGQNKQNSRSCKNTTSIYKGVYWNKRVKKWQAQIKTKSKRFYLGAYNCEKEAAIAYDKAAKFLFGEFACTNLIK